MARSAWRRSSRPAALLFAIGLAVIAQEKRDPAAWGSTHVGQPVPEYVTSNECFFCHEVNVGPGWAKNPHGIAVRLKADAPGPMALLEAEPKLKTFGDEVTHVLGNRRHLRYLKQDGYGKFDLSSFRADVARDGKSEGWSGLEKPGWERGKFENRCAGCHSSGVDPETKAFSQPGMDCYVCHGVVDMKHSSDTKLVYLSKKRRGDVQAITSTCSQCHLRGGRSRTTGLPWANNFVSGDNLFKDFEVDWRLTEDPKMNPGDRHIWIAARDVAVNGSDTGCLSCHALHANTTDKHRRVLTGAICPECHNAEGPKKVVKPYTVHSALCEY